MHLLIPSNWDEDLLSSLSQSRADIELYSALPTSMLGSGGTGPDIPPMTQEQAQEYIKLTHSSGLTFNYLINAPSMNNMEWDEDTHRDLLKHLDWLSNAGVDKVTVAIPYLAELIKHQFPHIKVEISTIAHVNSVARAELFESLGVDSIILHTNINRDFELLRAIRKAVKCELGILTNSLCLYQCPYEYYHNDTLGHATQHYNPLDGFYMDYCVTRCTLERFRDASQFIKSRWIRPEDVSRYEEIGIDFFKIAGRAMSSEWIINTTEAYVSGQYQGNLYDLLYVPNPKLECPRVGLPPKVYIDNQALEGFLDFFKKQDCTSGCARCNYCQKTADKVLRLDRPEADGYTSTLKRFVNDLTTSKMFLAKKY